MDTPFIPPFRVGDEVEIVKSERLSEIGQTHIIGGVNIESNSYEYSTDRAAWFDHDQFKLIRECCAETIAKLRQSIQDEDELEEEDDDDEEGDF
jgi:hypothetical protein